MYPPHFFTFWEHWRNIQENKIIIRCPHLADFLIQNEVFHRNQMFMVRFFFFTFASYNLDCCHCSAKVDLSWHKFGLLFCNWFHRCKEQGDIYHIPHSYITGWLDQFLRGTVIRNNWMANFIWEENTEITFEGKS